MALPPHEVRTGATLCRATEVASSVVALCATTDRMMVQERMTKVKRITVDACFRMEKRVQ
mgnify:FL=1